MGYTKLKDNGAEVAVEATNKVRIVGGILWGSEVAIINPGTEYYN